MNELPLLLCLETCEPRGTDFPRKWLPFAAFASVATYPPKVLSCSRKEPFVESVHSWRNGSLGGARLSRIPRLRIFCPKNSQVRSCLADDTAYKTWTSMPVLIPVSRAFYKAFRKWSCENSMYSPWVPSQFKLHKSWGLRCYPANHSGRCAGCVHCERVRLSSCSWGVLKIAKGQSTWLPQQCTNRIGFREVRDSCFQAPRSFHGYGQAITPSMARTARRMPTNIARLCSLYHSVPMDTQHQLVTLVLWLC